MEVSISARVWRDYEMVNRLEFEGMRGRGKAQGAGVVQWVWIRGGWRWKSGWLSAVGVSQKSGFSKSFRAYWEDAGPI